MSVLIEDSPRKKRTREKLNEVKTQFNRDFGFGFSTTDSFVPAERNASDQQICEAAMSFIFYKDEARLESFSDQFVLECRKWPDRATMHYFKQILLSEQVNLKKELKNKHNDRSISFNNRLLASKSVELSSTSSNNASHGSLFSNQAESTRTSFTDNSDPPQDDSRQNNHIDDEEPGPQCLLVQLIPDLLTIPQTDGATDESKPISPEQWQLRILPLQNLFLNDIDLPRSIHQASSRVRHEYTRLALHTGTCPTITSTLSQLEDYDHLWQQFEHHFLEKPARVSARAWSASQDLSTANVVFGAALKFQKNAQSRSIFELALAPMRYESKTNRFFRQFGSQRFLKVNIPSSRQLPEHLKFRDQYNIRIKEWLNVPGKKFMHCDWIVVHTSATTRAKKVRSRKDEASEGYEAMLFATNGPGLPSISREDLLNWFIPLKLNRNMSACKTFARIELGFSTTIATHVFKPNQIISVCDKLADGKFLDPSFDDAGFSWPDVHNINQPAVMNDGCCVMSLGAARIIWAHLQGSGPIPSAFQARLGPYKGMWINAGSLTLTQLVDPEDLAMHASSYGNVDRDDIWIAVSKSQKKWEPHLEDADGLAYDDVRLTFHVNSWSRKPTRSTLYVEYLPILEDRGVSKAALQDFVTRIFDDESKTLQVALEDPRVNGFKMFSATMRRTSLLASGLDQIAGFEPQKFSHTANLCKPMIRARLVEMANSLYIPLPRSTNIVGVADPIGCLAPNEIHMSFSSPWKDSESGLQQYFLTNIEVLVSRHPALRRSDIQKVKAVLKPELMHIVDVVVFPSTGNYPLAGKLQGGDYDGDSFWLCWEPCLVEPFKNAPAPNDPLDPHSLGIEIDKTRLGDILDSTAGINDFFRRSFEFAWQVQKLGICTNLHTSLQYNLNTMASEKLSKLADLHDLLVDTTKNGYLFGDEQWMAFILTHDLNTPNRREIAYKKAGDIELASKNTKHTPSNIIDFLIFDVARGQILEIMSDVEELLDTSTHFDSDITQLYDSFGGTGDDAGCGLAKNLQKQLCQDVEVIFKRYCAETHARGSTVDLSELFSRASHICQQAFDEIKPGEVNIVSDTWQLRATRHGPSYWDLVKASAVFKLHGRRNPDFAFAVAGQWICYLKANAGPLGSPQAVVSNVLRKMKMRKLPLPAQPEVGLPILLECESAAEQRQEELECEASAAYEIFVDAPERPVSHDDIMEVDMMASSLAMSSLEE